jgi:hypothetical protein
MLTPEQLQGMRGLLNAADREFENGDALAGTERQWDAITHTLTASAEANGWAYYAGDLFLMVKKLAERDEQVSYILEGIYAAAEGHPGLVRAEYFRFEYGDTHRARRLAREFMDTVLALAAQSYNPVLSHGGAMLTQEQLQTTQDHLAAADREFENANALAATERLWDAMALSLTTVADEKGWPYDKANLYPVVEKIAKMDAQVSEILLSSYIAAEGYPEKVHYGYFVWEDGDSHRMLRVVREFISEVQRLTE